MYFHSARKTHHKWEILNKSQNDKNVFVNINTYITSIIIGLKSTYGFLRLSQIMYKLKNSKYY